MYYPQASFAERDFAIRHDKEKKILGNDICRNIKISNSSLFPTISYSLIQKYQLCIVLIENKINFIKTYMIRNYHSTF